MDRISDRMQGIESYTATPWTAESGSPDAIIAGSVLGAIVLMVIILQLLNHRRRMAEMRYKALETLAKEGQLTPAQVEDFFHPRRARTKRWLVVSWFGLVTGVMLMIAGGMQSGPDAEELLLAGVLVTVGATALMATPVMLREFKKQGVI